VDKLLPDIYQQSIYTINYQKLKKSGIKCLIFSLNNTIAPLKILTPTKKMKNKFENLKDMGFKLIIMSNSSKKRVEPFKEILNVDSAYHSKKPFKRKYKKILNIYDLKPDQIACIGDQLTSDVLGANRMGMTSILVNPISNYEVPSSKIAKVIENFLVEKFTKDDRLKKGEYYE
jgi:HAD superfamily phosphatase (TIGR01668 family)